MFPFQPKRNLFDPSLESGAEETPYSSLFNGEAQQTPSSPPAQADPYMADIDQLRSNPGPMTSAYKKLAAQVPSEANIRPNNFTKIGAILAGAGAGMRDPSKGAATAESILRSPYQSALDEYKTKIGVTKQAADLEREDTQAQIQALTQARALGLKYDQFKLQQLEANKKAAHDQGTLKVSQARAKAYIANLNKPDYDKTIQEDGSVLLVNKRNPKDRQVIPAKAIQAGTLRVQQQNANTNAANAKSLAEYHKVMGTAATKRANASADRSNKGPTPYQQAKAYDLALADLYTDKRFGDKYITRSTGSDVAPYTAKIDDGSPMYKQFRVELKKKIEAMLRSGSPFGDGNDQEQDDDSDDITDIQEMQ